MENQVQDILNKAKRQAPRPSPYMATRTLALLRERQKQRRLVRRWKWFAFLSPAFCLALLLFLNIGSKDVFEAHVQSPYLVRVDVQELDAHAVAEAEIVLPDGVRFYSKAFPQLQNQRQLRLAWDQNIGDKHLPFVISSEQEGLQKVTVRFYDQNRSLILEKNVEIRFVKQEVAG